ncbi:MAG TPA: hypothetical protein VHI13_01545 [Candidatus Kapabacteria bacterium]|nr:hypothetical protein [Candidatus Kapabacteria bacterium]
MSDMRFTVVRSAPRIALLLLLALVPAVAARAVTVEQFSWNGNDLYVRFSDDVARTVDLAESDTSQMVIRLAASGLGSDPSVPAAALQGPNGRQAVLSMATPNELRLTVRSNSGLGYASLWRPYSHTLVVHTFNWKDLQYAQEQYVKGLLAFEQGMDRTGVELLELARSTGDNRASSVLGIYFARSGKYRQAAEYLSAPLNADDYAALADVQRHEGDSAGAAQSMAHYTAMLQSGTPAAAPAPQPHNEPAAGTARPGNAVGSPPEREPDYNNGLESNDDVRASMSRRWIYVAGGVVLLLLLTGLMVMQSRRSSRRSEPPAFEPIGEPPFTDVPVRPAPPPVADSMVVVEEAVVVERTEPAAAPVTLAQAEPVHTEPPHTAPAQSDAPPHDGGAHEEPPRAEPAHVEPAHAEPVQAGPVAREPAGEHVIVERVVVERIVAEPIAREPVPVEAVEVEPVAEEPAPAEEPLPAVRTEEPPVREARVVQERAVETPADAARRSMQTQAADLRRRIEEMRAATETEPETHVPPSQPGESTIAEARRLHLSRDSVELRRRLESAREAARQ